MEQAIVAKIYDMNSLSKEIREPISGNHSWSEYCAKLKSVQQLVNNALTQLVENERTDDSQLEIEEDDESSEDEADSALKRKSNSSSSANKKFRQR